MAGTSNTSKHETVKKSTSSRRTSQRGVVEWVYDHRIAVLATLAAYVLFAVAFLTAQIVISKKATNSEIEVDFTDLAKLQAELERAQELNRLLNEQYGESMPVQNLASNENALNDGLKDHRTDAGDIYRSADAVQNRIRGNAAEYEAGLRAEREILDRRYEGERQNDLRQTGNVTVSYSLSDPIRTAISLPVPAYMCQGGGDVSVVVTVDRSGAVVAAEIDRGRSADNACLHEAALQKARDSQFNALAEAPARQKGRINYKFVPQN
ncbi:MAG: energy transducer TonB [Tidjanibacter sp.]|nr:energy transducer TonB [Tidjanibacter sp.]